MKNRTKLLVALALAFALVPHPADAKKPNKGFEGYICSYLPSGWYVCQVIKPGR